MKNKMMLWALAIVTTILSGCATGSLTDTTYTAAPLKADQALIYIYRPSHFYLSASPDVPVFSINETEVGPLQYTGYYATYTAPGTANVSFTYNGLFGTSLFQIKKEVKLEAQANNEYYVKLEVRKVGIADWDLFLVQTDKNTAQAELAPLRLMAPNFSLK
jgi:Protein of unknown function (DUF2846)